MTRKADAPIIVLHHGLFGFGQFSLGPLAMSYFWKIDSAIAQSGRGVIVSRVHPTGDIALRARQLKENILRQLDAMNRRNSPLIVIAHSMGGLDARYMIHHLGMARRVAALVTITTPHHGSPYADWVMNHLGTRLRAAQLVRAMGLNLRAVADLTTESCRRFNDQCPDSAGVRYFSVSCAKSSDQLPKFLLPAWHVVRDSEGDNDGVVSVRSAAWGRHLLTWPVDHLQAINKRFILPRHDQMGDMRPAYLELIEQVLA